MVQRDDLSKEDRREEINSLLAFLTPKEAKALRTRFGIDEEAEEDVTDDVLEAMARELAILRKKKRKK